MNTKQLKQKILSLAIRGQLVPQDPSDEPASELLKRIKAERESTVEKGRKKKVTTDTSHYQQQPPFELPEGWVWCKVEDISQSYIGLTYSPKDVSSQGTIVLRSSNIQNGKIDLTDIVRVSKEIPSKLVVNANDIIICARNGSKKLVGKSAIFPHIQESFTFGAFMAICKTPLFQYVHLFLLSDLFFSQLEDVTGTTTIYQLTQNRFNSFLLPLPPLAEQKRIAQEIDRLFTLIEQLEEDKAALQQLVSQLKSKILSLAIRGQLVPQDANDEPAEVLLKRINPEYKSRGNLHYQPFEIPKSWVWCKLRDIGEIITGNTPSKDNDSNYGDDYPFYKPSDLEVGINIFDAQDKLSKQGYELARKLSKNTLLVTCIGSLGKCGIIKKEGSCNQQINAILSNEHIDMEYLYYVVSSSYFQKLIRKTASATTVAIINKRKFSDLIIPLPPLAEQQLISEKITELFNIIDNIQNALNS